MNIYSFTKKTGYTKSSTVVAADSLGEAEEILKKNSSTADYDSVKLVYKNVLTK